MASARRARAIPWVFAELFEDSDRGVRNLQELVDGDSACTVVALRAIESGIPLGARRSPVALAALTTSLRSASAWPISPRVHNALASSRPYANCRVSRILASSTRARPERFRAAGISARPNCALAGRSQQAAGSSCKLGGGFVVQPRARVVGARPAPGDTRRSRLGHRPASSQFACCSCRSARSPFGIRTVRSVFDQGVTKAEAVFDPHRVWSNELRYQAESTVVAAGRSLRRNELEHGPQRELTTDHGRALEHGAVVSLEAVEASRENGLNRGWHGDSCPLVGGHRRHLLHEERVPLGCLRDSVARGVRGVEKLEELGGLLVAQRVEGQSGRLGFVPRPVGAVIEKLGACKAEQQDWSLRDPALQVLHEIEEGRLPPMDVLEADDERPPRRRMPRAVCGRAKRSPRVSPRRNRSEGSP